jgi:hypothetical protein
LSHCLHIFHHLWAVCFILNSLLIGCCKICPRFLFCNSDQHNSAIQAFHHQPELNCHPQRGDNTLMQCQNGFIIQSRTLSFEKLIAVADTYFVRISAINRSLEIITGDTLCLDILLKTRKSCAL